jgi:hypothetical protein
MKEENACIRVDEEGKTETLDTTVLEKAPVVYFKNCKNGTYVLAGRSTKVLVENCHDCTFTFDGGIITSNLEVWRSSACKFDVKTALKTVQLDLSEKTTFSGCLRARELPCLCCVMCALFPPRRSYDDTIGICTKRPGLPTDGARPKSFSAAARSTLAHSSVVRCTP